MPAVDRFADCYVCDARGGNIDLVMHLLHKDFLEACKWLSDSSRSIIDFDKLSGQFSSNFERSDHSQSKPFDASKYARYFQRPWLSDEARHFLFTERHLDPRVVRWCRLTSWRDKRGIPWLQTPYYDRSGKLIGIQNRNLMKGAQPRFRFPQGASCSIYNLQILNHLKPGDTLFIAEGCSDTWSLMSAGYKAIAIPSATLLTRKDKELLQSLNSQPIYGEPVEPSLNLQLTEHFTLREFERSATAEKYHINNTVPSQLIPVLQQLCQEVLEPLRDFVGQPIIISSGYRCNQHNVKVGGAYASQHTLGEAADIRLPLTPYTDWSDNKQHTDLDIAHQWMDWLADHVDFDQLILETANGKDFWIHVSCRKNKRANRHQVIRYLKK